MRASNRFDIRRPAIRRWPLPISRETSFAWDVKHSTTRISTIRRLAHAPLDGGNPDPRYTRRPGGRLSRPRTDSHLGRTIGTQGAALQGLRAVRALAHRRVVRRARHYRAEHHHRKAPVAAVDRL